MRGYLAFTFRCNAVSHPGLQGLSIYILYVRKLFENPGNTLNESKNTT